MNLKITALILGLMAHSSVFAAATISTPDELIVVSVNDQEVQSNLLKRAKDFKVEAGPVNLNVRYQQHFDLENGQFDIQKSGIVNIQAPELKDNQHYKLVLVNAPKNLDEGKAFAGQPTIAIYDKNNQLIVQQSGAKVGTKPGFGGGIFSNDVDLTNSVKKQPMPVYGAPSVQPKSSQVVAMAPQSKTVTSVSSTSKDQQMIQIWQQSSKSDRQKFLSWLAEQ